LSAVSNAAELLKKISNALISNFANRGFRTLFFDYDKGIIFKVIEQEKFDRNRSSCTVYSFGDLKAIVTISSVLKTIK